MFGNEVPDLESYFCFCGYFLRSVESFVCCLVHKVFIENSWYVF